jgi:peptidoglycan/LPS O-acetylase OafA/YrhL
MSDTLTPAPVVKTAEKLHYINALRGLAILGVLLVHTGQYGTDRQYFSGVEQIFVDAGRFGVQLFFVASAFTLWLSMSRRKEEKHPTRNFALRRFFRIAPMYYVGLAFYTYWASVVQVSHQVTLPKILSNLTFLHGINPYWINSAVPGGWSITIEMWFYCLAPFLFTRLRTVDQAVRFIAYGILFNDLLNLLLLPLHVIPDAQIWSDFLYYFFPSQLPVFGFGILLFLLKSPSAQPKTLRPGTYLLVAGVALLSLMMDIGQHYWFAGAFLVLALGLSQRPLRLLVNPVLNYIGEVSFSLYLVHFAVLNALNMTGHSELVRPGRMVTALLDLGIRYILVVGIGVVLATIFYRLIEVPFQNVGKRLITYLES